MSSCFDSNVTETLLAKSRYHWLIRCRVPRISGLIRLLGRKVREVNGVDSGLMSDDLLDRIYCARGDWFGRPYSCRGLVDIGNSYLRDDGGYQQHSRT